MESRKTIGIQEKLSLIQSELSVEKSRRNNFGKYNYRNVEDILIALKPFLGIYEVNIRLTDEIVVLLDRFYIRATATLTGVDGSISTSAFAREEESKKGMDSAQVTGSASSYARKYALNGLLAINDTEDNDDLAASSNSHSSRRVKLISKEQRDVLSKYVGENNLPAKDCHQILRKYNLSNSGEIPVNMYDKIFGEIRALVK